MSSRFVTRLFPQFLQGYHGVGVLLLRLTLACSLALSPITGSDLHGFSHALVFLLEISAVVLLVVGFWTPVVGGMVCLVQFSTGFVTTEALQPHLLEAAIGLSIALLGPGFLSVDARLFGRRRVAIQD